MKSTTYGDPSPDPGSQNVEKSGGEITPGPYSTWVRPELADRHEALLEARSVIRRLIGEANNSFEHMALLRISRRLAMARDELMLAMEPSLSVLMAYAAESVRPENRKAVRGETVQSGSECGM